MPRLSKKFAVLLVLAMLASMFVGMGSVSAASTYTATSVVPVSAGNTSLGQIKVTIPAAELQPAATGDFFTVRLPSDFKFNLAAGAGQALVQVGATDYFSVAGDTDVQIRIPTIKNAIGNPVGPAYGSAGFTVDVLADNEIKINVNNTAILVATEADAYFYVVLNSCYVDSSSPATINAVITGRSGSPFSSAEVPVATYGSGITKITIDSVKTITTTVSAVDKIRIQEDRPGAFLTGQTIKIKAPSGFTWDIATLPVPVVGIFDAQAGATVPGLTRADDGRTLVITSTHNSATRASYFTIDNLKLTVSDETVAKLGDVNTTLSGTATSTPSNVVVAKYGDYSVTVAAFGDPKEVVAGKCEQEIGKFVIEESIGNSLPVGKSITATLTGGAKWVGAAALPTIDATNSKNTAQPIIAGKAWGTIGTNGDQLHITMGAAGSAAGNPVKAVFEKAQIQVSPNADSEIKIVFSGSAGVTGEVVVAKVIKPVTLSIDGNPAEVIIGAQGFALPTIIVTENKKEAIDATGTASKAGYSLDPVSGQYYKEVDGVAGFTPAGGDYVVAYGDAVANKNQLRLEFPMDVLPSLPTKVEVTEGDVVIDQSSVMRDVTPDGRWFIQVTTKSTSGTPAKIAFSGIKLNLSRTVPEGDMKVAAKGTSIVQTTGANLFPGVTSAAVCVIAKVITPADNSGIANGVFTIGSTTYKLNGIEATMEVAPYIKDGRTYLPLAYVAKILGIADSNMIWDPANQTVTLMKGDKVVQLKIGSKTMLVNGAAITLDVAPEITNGRTCLPIALVAQAFGASANWDPATTTVTIK